ncbi:MAG: HNH endonuclease [Gallionella sp.]|jgi:hypothetical protein
MKEIKLPIGETSIVDDEKFEELSQYKWHLSSSGYAIRYDCMKEGKSTSIFMHRQLLKTLPGRYVDHKNMNKLDNRMDNLRECSMRENKGNIKPYKNNKSGHKGVCWSYSTRKWMAQIKNKNGKNILLGFFVDKLDASKAYNKAAIKYFGSFARLNTFVL